jgi:hypothetical protein
LGVKRNPALKLRGGKVRARTYARPMSLIILVVFWLNAILVGIGVLSLMIAGDEVFCK